MVSKVSKCLILVWGMFPCFTDTPAFTLIMSVLQITYRMKYLVLLLLAVALRIHPLIGSLVWHSHWSWLCYKPISLIRSAFSQLLKHSETFWKISIHQTCQTMYKACVPLRVPEQGCMCKTWNNNTYSVECCVCWPCCTWSSSVHWVGFVYKILKFYVLL